MTTTALTPQQSSIWWFFLLQGIAGIILGFLLVTDPGATMLALVTFLGFYWLIMGILALVRIFIDRSVPWIWSLLTGIIGILAGILVLRHPLLATLTVPTVIVIVLGVEALIMGALEIIGGFTGGGIGSFIMGVIYVIAGLLLPGRLEIDVPPIPSLPGAPDVSVLSLTATLGGNLTYYERVHGRTLAYRPRGISLPLSCPSGGWALSASIAFTDGSTSAARTVVACPRARRRR